MSCAVICLIIAIAADETIAHGYGKAVLLGLFVTSIVVRTFWPQRNQRYVTLFFVMVAVFHVALLFIMPNDSRYPGGLLFPIGIADVSMFYVIYLFFVKQKEADAP